MPLLHSLEDVARENTCTLGENVSIIMPNVPSYSVYCTALHFFFLGRVQTLNNALWSYAFTLHSKGVHSESVYTTMCFKHSSNQTLVHEKQSLRYALDLPHWGSMAFHTASPLMQLINCMYVCSTTAPSENSCICIGKWLSWRTQVYTGEGKALLFVGKSDLQAEFMHTGRDQTETLGFIYKFSKGAQCI